jgi:hypothetical protein
MNRKSLSVPLLLAVGLLGLALIQSLAILRNERSGQFAGLPGVHRSLRVLFIGNSYTFGNNLPRLVAALAASAGRPMTTEMVTKGGTTLAQHWQDGQALAAIRRGNWDYVILQEHSTFGSTTVVKGVAQIGPPDSFFKYARLFDIQIKKIGAKTLFFLTWARRNAPQNQAVLDAAYLSIAQELHALVAPVGMAWADALQARPTLVLHQADLSHPDSLGSYLAACVFYATIYHQSPVGLTYHILDKAKNGLVDLNESDVTFLQTIAWKTVLQESGTAAGYSKAPLPVNPQAATAVPRF